MTREYILSDIEKKIGHKHNTWIWDITWIDPEDLEIYTTVVDESMRNYTGSGWDQIVHGAVPYGIYTGLRRTARQNQDHLRVISADSHPQLTAPMTLDEVFRIVEYIQEQRQPPQTQYQNLFEARS